MTTTTRPQYGDKLCEYPGCTRYNGGPLDETYTDAMNRHHEQFHADIQPGDGITEVLYSDTRGYVVLSRTAKTARVAVLPKPPVDARTRTPEYDRYTYTDTELDVVLTEHQSGRATRTIRQRADGRWYFPGDSRPCATNGARYAYDRNF